jgi:hypothetical protein
VRAAPAAFICHSNNFYLCKPRSRVVTQDYGMAAATFNHSGIPEEQATMADLHGLNGFPASIP